MTTHEQVCFNDALGRVQAFEWRDRTITALNRKLGPLNSSDKIALLRKVDALLA